MKDVPYFFDTFPTHITAIIDQKTYKHRIKWEYVPGERHKRPVFHHAGTIYLICTHNGQPSYIVTLETAKRRCNA